MSLVVDVLTGGVRGGTSIMYAGARRDRLASEPASSTSAPRARCCVGALARVRGRGRDRQPVGRRAGRRGSPAALLSLAARATSWCWRGANQFATGLTCCSSALGLTSLFGAAYVGQTVRRLRRVGRAGAQRHPVHRPDPLRAGPAGLPAATSSVPAVWWLLFRTRCGLLVRTAGERSDVLTVHGYGVARVRASRRSRSAGSSPASAVRTCRSPTPTRGSRTWSPVAASSPSRW